MLICYGKHQPCLRDQGLDGDILIEIADDDFWGAHSPAEASLEGRLRGYGNLKTGIYHVGARLCSFFGWRNVGIGKSRLVISGLESVV